MGNINIRNISCGYNICLDDLYEVDWFSEKNWEIDISDKKYKNNYSIKKGKFTLSNMNDVNIILNKKIKKNVKNLLLPLFFNYKSKCEFNILINLSNNDDINYDNNNDNNNNDNNNNINYKNDVISKTSLLEDINNTKNNIFTFTIKCVDNKIYLNDLIFENNNNKNLLNIFFNFEHQNILSSKIVFVQNNNLDNNQNNNQDKENFILQKNNLFYKNEYINLSIIIQIQKLESNEYIKLNL